MVHLYGGMDEPGLKIIDVFACHLRKKLAQATGSNHYIETVWGRGYRLRDPASMSAAKLVVPEDILARTMTRLGQEPLRNALSGKLTDHVPKLHRRSKRRIGACQLSWKKQLLRADRVVDPRPYPRVRSRLYGLLNADLS